MIYADHNATTPIPDCVRESMLPFLGVQFGNPSSLHRLGRDARIALRHAREQVAALAGVDPDEVKFTSGGTEANNWAIFGMFRIRRSLGRIHVITSAVEHPSILASCRHLEQLGAELTYIRVDHNGVVDVNQLRDVIRQDTSLVSIMHANNETGAVQPVAEIASLAAEKHVPFHVDAVQTFGKLPLNLSAAPISLITCSAHKIGGPKGAGMLVLRNQRPIASLLFGGKQEFGMRGGTENVAAIVGFGKAAELREKAGYDHSYIERLVDKVRSAFRQRITRMREVTPNEHDLRLPNTLTVCFEGVAADRMVIELDRRGIYVSSGSACSSGSTQPSHVLIAQGIPSDVAKTAIRFSFGPENSMDDAHHIAALVPTIVQHLRGE